MASSDPLVQVLDRLVMAVENLSMRLDALEDAKKAEHTCGCNGHMAWTGETRSATQVIFGKDAE